MKGKRNNVFLCARLRKPNKRKGAPNNRKGEPNNRKGAPNKPFCTPPAPNAKECNKREDPRARPSRLLRAIECVRITY